MKYFETIMSRLYILKKTNRIVNLKNRKFIEKDNHQ